MKLMSEINQYVYIATEGLIWLSAGENLIPDDLAKSILSLNLPNVSTEPVEVLPEKQVAKIKNQSTVNNSKQAE